MKEINDNEIRIVGHKPPKDYRKIVKIAAVAVLAIVIVCILIRVMATPKQVNESKNKRETEQTSQKNSMTTSDSTTLSYTEISDTVINDVKLRVYTPVNAVAEMQLGPVNTSDTNIVLAAQAADVREDNKEILGTFVLKGEQISHGKSRNGYCSIIDNKIEIGHCTYTNCYEEAVDKNGYFFRQYSLISDGSIVEVKNKGKAIRKALCWNKGKICIIRTLERESFHDFSQALADFGVAEAINLVGGDFNIFSVDKDGTKTDIKKCRYEKANYIVWKAPASKGK